MFLCSPCGEYTFVLVTIGIVVGSDAEFGGAKCRVLTENFYHRVTCAVLMKWFDWVKLSKQASPHCFLTSSLLFCGKL